MGGRHGKARIMFQPKAAKITLAVLVALSIGVLMVWGFTITANGQTEKPDFSGRWVMVSPAEGAGQEQVIKQDATTLTVHRRRRQTRNRSPKHLAYSGTGKDNYDLQEAVTRLESASAYA